MSKFTDWVSNAAKSDVGQGVVAGASDAYSSWVGDDDDTVVVKTSITDEPWFIPACVGAGILLLVVISKR